MQSTSKDPLDGEAVLALLSGITELYVAKGRKTLHIDLKQERPGDAELLGLLLGRSGKLRAPALRAGSRLVVGFNPDILGEALL